MKKYEIEKDGQIDFFDKFNIDYINETVLIDNTDGVWKGNILEFKLNINNLNKVLFQAIKYLSKMRIKGESIPSNILLVSLNEQIAYLYKSEDYFDDIHKVYFGGASKNNDSFVANKYSKKICYSTQDGAFELLTILKENSFMKIELDENCIVGWAERYYREYPKATKGDFLGDETGEIKIKGEIREPKHFNKYILPYTKKTNEKFKYLMDKLNDRLKKKDLGAFYTPTLYCEKAKELLEIAIARVPKGNDYIILDRCAGTGNLESVLSEEQLSHCILSTYEYYEYKVLVERLGDKVRTIIPPVEMEDTYDRGFVRCADAMSEEYINNSIIRKYIEDPNCTVILLENPPYRDDTSGMTGIKSKEKKIESFVLQEMKKDNCKKTNELANRFIWSAFKYYLRQETDSYVLFSPIKYWKLDKLIDKKFNRGYVFNKSYFHASPSAITCILWENIDEQINSITLPVYDITKDKIEFVKNQQIDRCYVEITKMFDKVKDSNDTYCNDFTETNGRYKFIENKKSNFNQNIIGYFVGRGFGISNPNLNFNLLRTTFSDNHGFYLRKDTYIKYLPLLSIKHHLMFERGWYETELLCCCFDNGFNYLKDKDFLKSCLIFTCLDYYNKCLSFDNVNGHHYQNELCFDENTVASSDLKKLGELNDDEKALLNLWNNILAQAKLTKNYNPKNSYGVYQITQELNESFFDEKTKKTIYIYPELNGNLEVLKTKLKEYYKNYISDKLIEYGLIK